MIDKKIKPVTKHPIANANADCIYFAPLISFIKLPFALNYHHHQYRDLYR
jgi:hypothetical protein